MLHVQNAIPLETLAAIKAEILDGLAWLENQVGERVPYITVMRSEFDPAMRTAYERLVMLLNEVLSPQFPYRDSIAAAAGCSEIQYIMAYAREARNDGGASAHVGFHQESVALYIGGKEKVCEERCEDTSTTDEYTGFNSAFD